MGPEAAGRAVSCLDLGLGADLCHSCSGSDDGTDAVKRHRKGRKIETWVVRKRDQIQVESLGKASLRE